MANIRTSALVEDVRGSVGGVTFTRSGAGATVRGRVKGVVNRSTKVTQQRSKLAQAASAWRGLTQAQRDGFNQVARSFNAQNKLGDKYIKTGEQLYIEMVSLRGIFGLAPLASAQLPVELPAVPDFDVTVTQDGNGLITALALDFDVDLASDVVIEATAPYSAGVSNAQNDKYRIIGTGESGVDTLNVLAMYQAAFGSLAIPSGAAVSFRVWAAVPSVGQGSKIKPHKKWNAEVY